MFWNSKNSVWNVGGRKTFVFGDKLPEDIVGKVGQATINVFLKKGWIDDGKAAAIAEAEAKAGAVAKARDAKVTLNAAALKMKADAEKETEAKGEVERDALFQTALEYGLKPHHRAGIARLEEMIDDYEALQSLRLEALSLGVEPSDDVEYAELKALVDEAIKAIGDESDISG